MLTSSFSGTLWMCATLEGKVCMHFCFLFLLPLFHLATSRWCGLWEESLVHTLNYLPSWSDRKGQNTNLHVVEVSDPIRCLIMGLGGAVWMWSSALIPSCSTFRVWNISQLISRTRSLATSSYFRSSVGFLTWQQPMRSYLYSQLRFYVKFPCFSKVNLISGLYLPL